MEDDGGCDVVGGLVLDEPEVKMLFMPFACIALLLLLFLVTLGRKS